MTDQKSPSGYSMSQYLESSTVDHWERARGDPPPMTEEMMKLVQVAYDIIRKAPEPGIQAKALVEAMEKRGAITSLASFYKYIVPELRKRGVVNYGGCGYSIEE